MTDDRIEKTVSNVLRAGVLISGSVVLAGGLYFAARHGGEQVRFRVFDGQPAIDCHPGAIILGALQGHARSIIQLGILLLIATPIIRVAVLLIDFALERDGATWPWRPLSSCCYCTASSAGRQGVSSRTGSAQVSSGPSV